MTKKTKSWIEAELEDTLDEMFEEEFNAPALTEEMRKIYRDKHPNMLDKTTESLEKIIKNAETSSNIQQ